VLPFHLEAARYWSLKSWDRTQIPKPWTTVALTVGAPIDIPPEADDEQLEAARQQLQACLSALETRARGLL
jgi:lysophospholipid acyltransferase (LPLAT)-like uncharacterized protein